MRGTSLLLIVTYTCVKEDTLRSRQNSVILVSEGEMTIMGKGTPKTLEQAIHNGLVQIAKGGVRRGWEARCVEQHVLDFLAQKFGPAILKMRDDEALWDLWKKIKKNS